MRIELEDLPQLKQIFQLLLPGHHLSNEDFGLYHELQDHEAEYESLLAALGYQLKTDHRGFYYLVPEDGQLTMTAVTQKMALLVFLLTEHVADEGRDPYTAITSEPHDIPEIAAALFEKYPDMLREGGFDDADTVAKYFLTTFRRLGFATVNGNMLHFRPPVCRFLDVCIQLGQGETADPETMDHE